MSKSLKKEISEIQETYAKFIAECPAVSAPTLFLPKYHDIKLLLKQLDAFIDSYNAYVDQQISNGQPYLDLNREIEQILEKLKHIAQPHID